MSRKPPETPPPRMTWSERNQQIREEFQGLDELCDAFRAEFAARLLHDHTADAPPLLLS